MKVKPNLKYVLKLTDREEEDLVILSAKVDAAEKELKQLKTNISNRCTAGLLSEYKWRVTSFTDDGHVVLNGWLKTLTEDRNEEQMSVHD